MKKKYENFSLNANATLNTNSKKLNQTVGPKKFFCFFPNFVNAAATILTTNIP